MYENYSVSDDLKRMINNERVVWSGKPKKSCFILECIFNPMLPFALIWLLIDSSIFLSMSKLTFDGSALFFVAFFLLHMMPVWIYFGGVIFSFRKYKNTEYAITDRGIYVTSGCFAKQFNFKPFTDLSHVDVHRGIFDQFLGVGDVISSCHHIGGYSHSRNHHSSSLFKISDIPDYIEVCNLIKQYQTDIYADTQYPNDFRPSGNHGYRTNYYGGSNSNPTSFYGENNANNGCYGGQYPNQTNGNGYYNNQNYNNNFYGSDNTSQSGYNVNGEANNYDSWDNPNTPKDREPWERQ